MKFLNSFFLIIILLPVFMCGQRPSGEPEQQQTYNCTFFQKGKFVYTTPPKDGIMMKRSGSRQKEFNKITGEKTIFKVKWVSNCEYHLTLVKSNRAIKMKKGHVIEVKMTETYHDYYNYEADYFGIFSWGSVMKLGVKPLEEEQPEEEGEEVASAEGEAETEEGSEPEADEGEDDEGKKKKKDKKKKDKKKKEKKKKDKDKEEE